MAQNSLVLEGTIPAAPETLIDFLMLPENYIGLQPFMASSRTLERGVDKQGRAFVHYAAVERVPVMGAFRVNTPLDVISTVTQPGAQIVTVVNSSFRVQVEFVYDFRPVGASSQLTLRVTAHAPRLLTRFILARAKEAQTVVLNTLREKWAHEAHKANA